jgi:YMGG-like Gly-zipper
MRARALLAVAAVTTGLGAMAVPASAQTYGQPPQGYGQPVHPDAYCAQVRQNRMMTGGALGAALGAVLGNNVSARHHQGDGSLLGGVVGAAAGAAIGRNTGACGVNAQRRAQGYGYGQPQQPAYGYPQEQQPYGQPTYGEDRYPLEGGPDGYRNSGYGNGGGDPNCRWGTVSTRDPDGREVRDSIYMCRGRDGVWRAQQPY